MSDEIRQTEDFDRPVSTETLTAKVVMIGNEMGISSAMLEHLKVDRHEDDFLRRLVYSIETYIVASGEEIVSCDYEWPADWWEAVKDRWAPEWFKARWPVRYKEHRLYRTFHRAMCPHISIPLHQGNRIHFEFLRDGELNRLCDDSSSTIV